MENEEINTSESIPGAEQNVPAAEGTENVSEVDGLTLEELSALSGRTFPSKDAALKAIKDTFSYVGKLGQEVKQLKQQVAPSVQPPAELIQKVESLERVVNETSFYKDHPEYEPYKDLIASMGAEPRKVVESQTFKTYFEKARTADQFTQSKSVLHTNPRLGQVTDKLSRAREAQKAGDSTTARTSAVGAVLDAYETN